MRERRCGTKIWNNEYIRQKIKEVDTGQETSGLQLVGEHYSWKDLRSTSFKRIFTKDIHHFQHVFAMESEHSLPSQTFVQIDSMHNSYVKCI